MENNSSLFKQAIAEAKALRQSAYELAKEQIAETFGPRVQEMIRLKLSEMEEEPVVEAKDEEEKKVMETVDQEESVMETEDVVDETTLDELLAELEETDEVSEAKKDDEKEEIKEAEGDEEETDEEETDEESEEETEETGGEEVGDEPAEEVTELSVEELKDIIRDVVADVMGGGEGAEDNLEGDDTIDLSSPGAEEAEPDMGGEESLGEITLDEILASLEEADKEPMEEKKEEKVEETKKVKQDLQEALKVVKTLQTELNEVRLLNAKLLYVNKIFNSNSLTESQKLKVINAFDRAENVKEAKKIYETLKDSIVTKKPLAKKPIRESMGFASKPAGVAPRVKPIVEQDNIVNRWQVLAGIKKAN